MPKNFQISQYEEPLAEEGWLEIDRPDGPARRIGIQRLHLEEDVGKLVHEGTLETAQASLVAYTRAGVPLMETVSKPEIRSPEEAAAYLRAFRAVLVYLGVCDGNMEEGSLRCDANVSLKPAGAAELGTKVEIKNMNSFRNVQRALEFEVKRQAAALERGERVVQETRLWDADRGYTRSMRSKEFAHDYRYFPEPDLVPLKLDAAWIDEIRRALPELPRARQLGQRSADLVDPRGVELQRDEVGLGEIAVVVRELLGAHRARVAAVRVPEPRFLNDPLASVERLRLALDLELKSPLNVAEGVHVLDLDLGAELRRARRLQRDVGVAAQRALFHVAVADAEVDEHGAEGAQVRGRLFGRADLRLAHGLHEGHARAVEVDQARLRRLERTLVHQLADVLFEVQPLDADAPRVPIGPIDLQPTLLGQRLLVLADLEVLRHVRAVAVLPGKATRAVHAAVERERGAHAVLDRAPGDHRP